MDRFRPLIEGGEGVDLGCAELAQDLIDHRHHLLLPLQARRLGTRLPRLQRGHRGGGRRPEEPEANVDAVDSGDPGGQEHARRAVEDDQIGPQQIEQAEPAAHHTDDRAHVPVAHAQQ
ncbi:MAG: hypothetical protein EXQ96_10595 [Alphaproteobacteria bacterium]|nr:hypothetical protein [Alphaproteobacteria bacterium]